MEAKGMSWVTCRLLLTAALATATPANDRPVNLVILDEQQLLPRETFHNGFPEEFSHNLPTQEFMGDFARRHKRQVDISSAIDGILSAPYGGLPATSHLQALLLRNTNVRPARQSSGPVRPDPPSFPSSPSQSINPSSGASFQAPQRQALRPLRQSPSFAPARQPSRPSNFRVIHERPSPSPARLSPSARERPNAPSRRPFFPSSITGHQIAPTFSGSFFESARLPRQKRDVRQDVSAQLSQGSLPSTIASLFNRVSRIPRPPQTVVKPATAQVAEQPGQRSSVEAPSHSFEIPFVIPNFFEQIGIRRRRDAALGVSDAIDEILRSPYQGGLPTSMDVFFRDNRFVRKTQPSREPFLHPQPSSLGSDNPSQAAVRLFPNSNTRFTSLDQTEFRTFHGRAKRDVTSSLSAAEGQTDLLTSASRYRIKPFINIRPRPFRPQKERRSHERRNQLKNVEFGEPTIEYVFGGQDPSHAGPEPESLKEYANRDELKGSSVPYPFGNEPSNFLSNLDDERIELTLIRPGPRPVGLPPPQRFLPRFPPTQNVLRLQRLSPGLRPGPSPPAHILPPASSVRAPRHILLENRRLPVATRQQDIPIVRRRRLHTAEGRMSVESVSSDADAAKKDSPGFIFGRPANFPRFSSVGGFGPMGDVEIGNVAGNFMEEFRIPVVEIPGIREKQPQFSPLAFHTQVSAVREEGDVLSQHTPSFKQGAFPLAFPHEDVSPTTKQPPTSNDIIPNKASDHRPSRPPRPTTGRAKKPVKSSNRGLLSHIHDLVRPSRQRTRTSGQVQGSEARHHEDSPRMKKKLQVARNRIRRRAGQPDHHTDESNVPHRRVHRVQESQVAHDRSPRGFLSRNSEAARSVVPLSLESSPGVRQPVFQLRRAASATSRSRNSRNKGFTPVHPSPTLTAEEVKVGNPDDDVLISDSQRFHPTITGRHSPSAPSAKQSFFPSPPLQPRAPGPRRGRLLSHGPGFRGSSSQREPAAFRDFHNSFFGPGTRDAIHKPEFTFPNSRRPFQREQETGELHNSILGSGNFEVLRGGTFYDDDDPNGYGQGYDHLLDDAYGFFPETHTSQHANNYVDDFFSNFRDFSDFAVRKSKEGESTYLDDSALFGRGYASEPVFRLVNSPPRRFNVSSEQNPSTSEEGTESGLKTVESTNHRPSESEASEAKDTQDDANSDNRHNRRPKNIQEVLEDIDPRPSEYSSSSLTVDDGDPMIAMF